MLTFVLQITGIYFNQRQPSFSRRLASLRMFAILTATVFFAFYFTHKMISMSTMDANRVTPQSFDIEYLFSWGLIIQSMLSILFLTYWQHFGYLQFIFEQVFTFNFSSHCKSKLLRSRKLCFAVLLVTTVSFFLTAIHFFVKNFGQKYFAPEKRFSKVLTKPCLYWNLLSIFVQFYGVFVWNAVIFLFIIVVHSISVRVKNFNRQFKFMLELAIASPFKNNVLSDRLLAAFHEHNQLASEIKQLDSIFRVYTFVMLTAVTIFGLLLLLRRDNWVDWIFTGFDVACCFYHLFGLCLIPAQIYNEYRSVQQKLWRQEQVWLDYNLRVYQIAKMFAENAANSNIGITLWGITVITKPLILMGSALNGSFYELKRIKCLSTSQNDLTNDGTNADYSKTIQMSLIYHLQENELGFQMCLSLIVPYVLLFLQLQLGIQNDSWTLRNVVDE